MFNFSNFKNRELIFLLYFGLALLIYASSLNHGYFLDDVQQIVNNQIIHDLSNWYRNFSTSTMDQGGTGKSIGGIYYKPIMMICYSVLWNLKNGGTFPFHLFQLLLHSIKAVLIFKLFYHLFPKDLKIYAILAGLIFLVHPINSEAVLFIADLQEPLYTFFGLFALLVFVDLQKNSSCFWVGLLLLCSLLCKESGVLYAFMALVYCILFKRSHIFQLLSAVAAAIGVYLFLRLGIADLTSLHSDTTQLSRADITTRLMTMPKVLIHYIHLFFYPGAISLTQDWVVREMTLLDFWIPLFEALTIIVGIFVYYFKTRDRIFLFFALVFAAGWGMHSQIIPLDGTVSDRWFYFSIVGFLGLIFKFLSNELNQKFKKAFICLVFISSTLLAVRSYSRSLDWRSNLSLYQNEVQIDPESFYLNNNLGLALLEKGQLNEALKAFEKTVSVSSKNSIPWLTAHRNIGAVCLDKKEYDKAESYFRIAMADNTLRSYRGAAGSLQAQQKYKELSIFLNKEALLNFPNDPILLKIQMDSPKE